MKKVFVFSALVFAFCFAETSFAAKVCLQDSFGEFWELKDGKIDKKSYTFKLISPGNCVLGGIAEVTATNSSSYILTALSSHPTTGLCVSVMWSATVDSSFAGSGFYDQNGDGSITGPFSLTPINCSALPPTLTDKTQAVDPNSPILKKY